MRQTPAAVKVGTVVILGSLLLLASSVFLRKSSLRGRAYTVRVGFTDAQGVLPDSDLRMAGKKIGVVARVDLADQDAPDRDGLFIRNGKWVVATCRVLSGYNIPVGSRWVVTTNSLVGVPFVDIKPVPRTAAGYLSKDGRAEVLGSDSPSMASIMEGAEASVGEVGKTLRNANTLMAQLGTTATTATGFIGDPRLKAAVLDTLRNLSAASANIRAMSARIAAMERRMEPAMLGMASDLKSTTGRINGAAADIRPVMGQVRNLARELTDTLAAITGTLNDLDLGQSVGKTLKNVEQASANAQAITANVDKASQRLDAIMRNAERLSGDVADITSDPQFKQDVAASLKGIRETAEKASILLDKLNGISGRRSRLNLRVDSEAAGIGTFGNHGTFRLQYNAALTMRDSVFLLGARDIGDGNRVNLQYGRRTPTTTLRAGLYASKLGAGIDYSLSDRDSLHANLWNQENTQLDLYGRRMLGKDVGLTFGIEDVFDEAIPALGLTYKP
jgi:ABC-type transporter Mla subunit MlaD